MLHLISIYVRRKAITKKLPDGFWSFFSPIMLGFLFCECPDYPLLIFINFINPSYGSVVKLTLILTLKFRKIVSWTIFNILSIYIYSIALTPATCILCLMVFHSTHTGYLHFMPYGIP